MGPLALVMLAAPEFDNTDLVALAMTLDGSDHLGRAHVGRANGDRGPGADQQHLGEFDAGTLVGVELLDTHHGTFLDAVLFTARGDHGIHCCNSAGRPMGPQKSRGLYRVRAGGSNRALASLGALNQRPFGRVAPFPVGRRAAPRYGGPPRASRQSDRS